KLLLCRHALERVQIDAFVSLGQAVIVLLRDQLELPNRERGGILVVRDARPRVVRGGKDAVRPGVGVRDWNVVRTVGPQQVREAITFCSSIDAAYADGEARHQLALE